MRKLLTFNFLFIHNGICKGSVMINTPVNKTWQINYLVYLLIYAAKEDSMDSFVQDALLEWKVEMLKQKIELDQEYDLVKSELQLYSYKFGITKQVIQSTINEKIISNIKTTYQRPFEEKYNELKQYIMELEEKRKVFQMFVDKIDKVSEMGARE